MHGSARCVVRNKVACRSKVMTYKFAGDPERWASEKVEGFDFGSDEPRYFAAEEEYPLKDSQTGQMKEY